MHCVARIESVEKLGHCQFYGYFTGKTNKSGRVQSPTITLPLTMVNNNAASASTSTPQSKSKPAPPPPVDDGIDKLLDREAMAFQREIEITRILKAFKLKSASKYLVF